MIRIERKQDCCGCEACRQICPKACITMQRDEQGFLYPNVNESNCIDCGLCEKVCPVINQSYGHKPISTFAAKHLNEEIRMNSSSGGIFSALSEETINAGGIVFGACFDEEFNVIHNYATTLVDCKHFRGSKYVQSRIGDSYIHCEKFLKEGKLVLFSGTPCQVAGLKKYLRKEYPNLLTIDVVCHGVPSPVVWQEYLKSKFGNNKPLYINFRDKQKLGWNKFGLKIITSKKQINQYHKNNNYMLCFLSDLCLRPSCYSCSAKAGKGNSDITLGDWWGLNYVHPEFFDNIGCTLILCNTQKGLDALNKLNNIRTINSDYNEALKYNPAIEKSCNEPPDSKSFWDEFQKNKYKAINKYGRKQRPTLYLRTKIFIYNLIHK